MAAELDAAATEVTLDGRRVRLTNLERPIMPGWRKRDLLAYYLDVADVLLPHIRARPLTMARFPDGVRGRAFLQNECRGSPAWMRVAELALKSGVRRRYCVVDDRSGLAWVVNLSTVELHPYLVDAAAPDCPVGLVIDLDPGPGRDVADCCRLALRVRELLGSEGLRGAAKTSGGAGVHVISAVSGWTFHRTRALAHDIAARLAEEHPGWVTEEQRPASRAGAVFVDWLQNASRRSTIAPYSLRATVAGPRVSAPLSWEEVAGVAAGAPLPPLDPRAVLERIQSHGDLFAAAAGPRSVTDPACQTRSTP